MGAQMPRRMLLALVITFHCISTAVEEVEVLDGFNADLADMGESAPDGLDKLIKKIAIAKKPGPLVVRSNKEFTSIPNFKYPGTPVDVKSKEGCVKACDDHKQCRSVSYRTKDKRCFWSTGSLRYDHEWDFYSKEFDLDAYGRMVPTDNFNKFNGLMAIDEDQNMKTEHDKSLSECKDICNDDTKCLSFSFHERQHACLMGIAKVQYASGWNYLERNKAPTKEDGKWMPYPLRLDSYHRKERREELKTLKLFAERDKKIRLKKERKQDIVKTKFEIMQKKTARLAKEEKVKMFAREQSRKKAKARKKARKEDREAAQEKGKFDEAFHKQAEKNKELMHKCQMEKNTKVGVKEAAKKKEIEDMRKFQVHLATMKRRGLAEINRKTRVTKAKEKTTKLARKERAEQMKNNAFKLVLEERKFKSNVKHKKRVKKLKKSVNGENRRLWKFADIKNKAIAGEREAKRKIKMAHMEKGVKLKLIKEKLSKKTQMQKTGNMKVIKSTKKKTLPRPDTYKSKALPKSGPGVKKPRMDVSKKATSPR